MFGTQKEEEIDNYTDYSDADPFLSLPIRKEKEMIRCIFKTDYKAVVCLYCRTSFHYLI